ncbi:MAG: zf-TFIIB domain-containing protein [Thermoanaerobaculales bacterium]|nr:zf-TFIIB domain-containing protein [Thermoanaerobaculales bacterium]
MLQGLLMFPFIQDEFEGKAWAVGLAWTFPLFLMVASGVFLIVKRSRLAAWISHDIYEDPSEESSKQLPALAFAILGLYLVVSTIPSLGSLAGQLINLRAMENSQDFLPAFRTNLGHYLGTLAEFVVGGYLFINARDVARWWRRCGKKLSEDGTPASHQCPECGTPFEPGEDRDGVAKRLCSKCRAEIPDAVFEE